MLYNFGIDPALTGGVNLTNVTALVGLIAILGHTYLLLL